MTALNATAKAPLLDAAVSQAEWARVRFGYQHGVLAADVCCPHCALGIQADPARQTMR